VVITFDADAAQRFLEEVFGLCPPEEWVSVYAIDRGTANHHDRVIWAQVGNLDQLVKQVAPIVRSHCVWFGVATRKKRLTRGRGGIDDCAHLPVLYADIDLEGPGHKASGYPPDEDAVRTLLSKIPGRPTIIATGGGYHPYWRLDAPLAVPDPGVKVLEEWGNGCMQAAEECGWKIDNVFNVDRILRLPFTWNRKKELAVPIPVTILGSF
jgi:hypothetical protein